MKFNIKGYYRPTPQKIQKLTDAVQGACLTALGYSAITSNKTLTIIMVCALVISKFLSECVEEEKDV